MAHLKSLTELVHGDTCLVEDVLGWPSREQPCEFVVKGNELFGDLLPLELIR